MDLAGMEPVSNSRPAGGHTDRLAFIDCLRAIAVILVFLTHSTEIFSGIATGGAWLTETAHRHDFGRIGVVLFFAISGFLIPSSLRGRTGEGSRRFLLSRFFRLFPAFWVSIPISVWAHFWIVHVPITNRDVLLNFTMIPRAFGAQMVNGAYWTLEVELLFYGLCLFLFLGEILRNSFVLATLCFFSGFLFYSSQRPIFGGLLNPALSGEAFYMLLNLSVMFWGAVCRRMWDGEKLSPITAVMFWTYTAFWIIYRPAHLIYRLVAAHSIDLGMLRTVSGYSGGMALFAGGLAFRRRLTGGLAWLGAGSATRSTFCTAPASTCCSGPAIRRRRSRACRSCLTSCPLLPSRRRSPRPGTTQSRNRVSPWAGASPGGSTVASTGGPPARSKRHS
jgi:peptidoglycan/LPS O-acetylase OafA/YrhL